MFYFQQTKEELVPRMGATDPHCLYKLYETRATALVTELYLTASLERRETRAGHYREDFPERDEKLLGWIHLQKGESGIVKSFRRCRWSAIDTLWRDFIATTSNSDRQMCRRPLACGTSFC